jgi:hypothetical protein
MKDQYFLRGFGYKGFVCLQIFLYLSCAGPGGEHYAISRLMGKKFLMRNHFEVLCAVIELTVANIV